ncbi:MAG TPA: ABC transporter ATP-binding protein [Protaetiibacter sp.]|nr:ABC transporter ATP-binding protein [Protaetiibacter sp.]
MSGVVGRPPVLEYSDVSVSFGEVVALRNFSLTVAPGERVGLIGESGSGKTTAGLAGMGIIQHGGHVARGEIRVDGTTVVRSGERQRATLSDKRLAMVFQDAKLSFDPLRTIGSHLSEVLAVRRVPRSEWRAISVRLLEEVGLPRAAESLRMYAHQLSGGMRQRAMIAVALAAEPEVLIADEPTSALDVTTQAAVIDLLLRLSRERAMAVVLISHDIELVRTFADRVLVMKSGEVVEEGDGDTLFDDPQHPYTRALLASVPTVPEVSSAIIQLIRSGEQTDEETRSREEQDRLTDPIGLPELRDDALIAVRDLSKVFSSGPPIGRLRRRFTAVDHVSLDLIDGETLGIVGASGSGKTTIARMIAGLLRPSQGDIRTFFGASRTRSPGDLQMVFQDPADTLDPLLRVAEAVAEPLCIQRGGRPVRYREEVRELLERVGLGEEYLDRLPAQLSGGQRQRVAIARALSTRPRVIIADEPVSALDASLRSQILGLFGEVQHEYGVSIIQITHDLLTARESCDRIAVMYHGRIVEFAAADALFADPQHPYTQRLIAAIPAVRANYRTEMV